MYSLLLPPHLYTSFPLVLPSSISFYLLRLRRFASCMQRGKPAGADVRLRRADAQRRSPPTREGNLQQSTCDRNPISNYDVITGKNDVITSRTPLLCYLVSLSWYHDCVMVTKSDVISRHQESLHVTRVGRRVARLHRSQRLQHRGIRTRSIRTCQKEKSYRCDWVVIMTSSYL